MPPYLIEGSGDPGSAGFVRPRLLLLHVCPRPGPAFRDGVVLRIFPPRCVDGYGADEVADMIGQSLDASRAWGLFPRLVVLPAGVGQLDPVHVLGEEWAGVDRAAVRAAIHRWGRALGQALPPAHPVVVFGLDAAATFEGGEAWSQAVQAAVVLEQQEVVHVTHKTKPCNVVEDTALDLWRDPDSDRPANDVLLRHEPVALVGGEPLLLLVCHDAAAFSGRSRAASSPTGDAASIAAQYDALLAAPAAPRVALNLLHELPRHRDARSLTSPVFQNAHRVLHERYGVRVIAVSAVHPDALDRASQRLHTDLRCDFASVDVFFRPPQR